MVARGEGGVIINPSSTVSYRVFGPGLARYSATKHANGGRGLSGALDASGAGLLLR